MLDRFLDALTGRRLGGALFVFAGLVVAGVVLWPSDDGDRDGSRTAAVQRARIVSIPQLGLAFAYPATWSRSVSGRVIRLHAPDGAVLTFASPVAGRHDKQVKADAVAALRERFRPAEVVKEGPAKLGPRKAASFEVEGIGPDGGVVRALAVTASSEHRTYVTTLVTAQRPSAKTLAQVQQVLATVRLTKPVLPSKE